MKERLVTDPIIASFEIMRERATPFDGHLRARLVLVDGSQLEFSEYMQRSRARGEVEVITYSYHWADANMSSSSVGITHRTFQTCRVSLITFTTGALAR